MSKQISGETLWSCSFPPANASPGVLFVFAVLWEKGKWKIRLRLS